MTSKLTESMKNAKKLFEKESVFTGNAKREDLVDAIEHFVSKFKKPWKKLVPNIEMVTTDQPYRTIITLEYAWNLIVEDTGPDAITAGDVLGILVREKAVYLSNLDIHLYVTKS